MRIRDWTAEITSPQKGFDIVNGARLWEQDFGVAGGTNAAPQMRKYMLEEANYLRSQLRLYVCVSDAAESRVFKVLSLIHISGTWPSSTCRGSVWAEALAARKIAAATIRTTVIFFKMISISGSTRKSARNLEQGKPARRPISPNQPRISIKL